MESQAARRRVKMISAHFAANHDMSAVATHVFPMNCSSGLNTVIRRRDNRTNFARQGSSSQAYFMRQVSTEQMKYISLNTNFPRPYFQAPLLCNLKLEQDDILNGQSSMPLKSTDSSIERFRKSCEEPLFSRSVVPDSKLSAPEPPTFARPNRGGGICAKDMFYSEKNIHAFKPFEWSPKMDIGEYGCNYVLLVELPGVSTKDIKVEVNDKSLIVKGNRSTELWRLASFSNDSISAYHKKEILQGPYQIVWPLPTNVDRDNVSAKLVDGLLRITIPKL